MKDCTVHRCRLAMFVCCPIYCAFFRIVNVYVQWWGSHSHTFSARRLRFVECIGCRPAFVDVVSRSF